MFAKIVAFLALVAVALAAPKPQPAPQLLTYPGLDYMYPGAPAAAPLAYSPYAAAPLAYSAYSAYPNYYVR